MFLKLQRLAFIATTAIVISVGSGDVAPAQQATARNARMPRLSLSTGIELTAAQMRAVIEINKRTEEKIRELEAVSPRGRPSKEALEALYVARAQEIYRKVLTSEQRERWSTNARELAARGNPLAKRYEKP